MAQRTENEETEFKVVPEAITLCVSCNVAGNCSANNLCSKCLPSSTTTSSSGSISPKVKSFRSSLSIRSSPERKFVPVNDVSSDLKAELVVEPVKRVVNRCSGCRRKVGLTGFRCRCGDLFCAEHRYSDRHECSYDYKAAGREAIARENPMVKAAKIVRI